MGDDFPGGATGPLGAILRFVDLGRDVMRDGEAASLLARPGSW